MECLRRIRKRQGRCYELALRVMMDEPGADRFLLVHGTATMRDGSAADHAWIAIPDEARVYDAVLDRYFLPAEYAARYGAKEARRYTAREAAEMVLASKHGGPWHDPRGHSTGPPLAGQAKKPIC